MALAFDNDGAIPPATTKTRREKAQLPRKIARRLSSLIRSSTSSTKGALVNIDRREEVRPFVWPALSQSMQEAHIGQFPNPRGMSNACDENRGEYKSFRPTPRPQTGAAGRKRRPWSAIYSYDQLAAVFSQDRQPSSVDIDEIKPCSSPHSPVDGAQTEFPSLWRDSRKLFRNDFTTYVRQRNHAPPSSETTPSLLFPTPTMTSEDRQSQITTLPLKRMNSSPHQGDPYAYRQSTPILPHLSSVGHKSYFDNKTLAYKPLQTAHPWPKQPVISMNNSAASSPSILPIAEQNSRAKGTLMRGRKDAGCSPNSRPDRLLPRFHDHESDTRASIERRISSETFQTAIECHSTRGQSAGDERTRDEHSSFASTFLDLGSEDDEMVKKDLGFGAPLPQSINCATAWANEGENTTEDTTISDSLSDPNASAKLSPTVRSGTNAPTVEDRGGAPAGLELEKLEDGCECHREESLDEVVASFLQRGPGEQIRQERFRSWSRDVLTRLWMGASTTESQDVIGHATTPKDEAEIAASPNSSSSEHNYSSFDSSGSNDEESDEEAVDDSRDAQILHCWRRRPAIPLAFLGASHENGHLSETPPRSHARGKDASVVLPPCAEPLVPLMPHAKLTTLMTDRPRLIKKKTSFAPSLRSVVEEHRAEPIVVSHSGKVETASSASSGQGSKDMCFSLDHSWLLDDASDFDLCRHLLDRANLNLALPRQSP